MFEKVKKALSGETVPEQSGPTAETLKKEINELKRQREEAVSKGQDALINDLSEHITALENELRELG